MRETDKSNSPKISIIVPVYNSKQYLPKSIDSVLSQDFKDFEVLLINDGSTDNSGAICDDYASKDDRIRVFHKENGGVSSARNLGMDNATGEWIAFVDSDDFIYNKSLGLISKQLVNNNLEIIVARSFLYNADEAKQIERYFFPKSFLDRHYSGLEVAIDLGFNRGSVCGVLFRKSFLLENSIYFVEKLKNSEDALFFTFCLIHAKNISFADVKLYSVVERIGSASRDWTEDRVLLMLSNIEYINEYIALEKNINPQTLNVLNYLIYRTVSTMFNSLSNCYSNKTFKLLVYNLNEILPKSIDTGAIKTSKIKVRLLNFSICFFGLSVLIKNKLIKN